MAMLASVVAVTMLAQPSAAYRWNQMVLETITVGKPGPPHAARALALTHTAIYDAWTAYDDTAVPVHAKLIRVPVDRRTDAAKEAAVSSAAYAVLVDLFPAEKPRLDAALAQSASHAEGSLIGRIAAHAVLDYAHQDGSNQSEGYADKSGYKPVNSLLQVTDPNRWQPQEFVHPDGTRQVVQFIAPHWGTVKTFAISNVPEMRPPPPPVYGSEKYKAQADKIIELTYNLSEKEKVVAEYWADGPRSVLPPGHWSVFGGYVSRRDQHTLEQDVKLFFLLGNAVHDAAICCWDTKRHYDYVRPITAIRYLYKGQTIKGWRGPGKGFGDIPAEEWIPYQPASFITPPFAEYTSGHSTFSSAGAEILKRFTGSDAFGASATFAKGSLKTEPGYAPAEDVTLSWPTFTAAAEEAGMSRRWGGIHFEDSDLLARKAGREIGKAVWEKAQTYFDGTAKQ